MYQYNFTTDHPPLMKDIRGPGLDIPASDLERLMGTAHWTARWPATGVGEDFFHRFEFTVQRKLIWARSDAPHHYAQDRSVKVTTVHGYSKAERETFSRTFNADAGGQLFGWNVDIKAELKITDETEQQWHEETTTQTDVTFKADNWYVSWTLLDILFGTKVVFDWYQQRPTGVKVAEVKSEFKVIMSVYDDHVADPDHNFISIVQRPPIIRPLGPLG